MQHRETNSMSVISAFVIGGLIGAGVALLMAPQSGHETRSMLRNRGEEIRDKASDLAHEKSHQAHKAIDDITDRTKRTAEEMRQRGHDVMDDAERRM
jgi:gas vesicle protein